MALFSGDLVKKSAPGIDLMTNWHLKCIITVILTYFMLWNKKCKEGNYLFNLKKIIP